MYTYMCIYIYTCVYIYYIYICIYRYTYIISYIIKFTFIYIYIYEDIFRDMSDCWGQFGSAFHFSRLLESCGGGAAWLRSSWCTTGMVSPVGDG